MPDRRLGTFTSLLPVKGASTWERSNPTPVPRNKGKIGLNCDLCTLPFEKYACWAKRVKHNYCSRACANEARKIEIPSECVVCKKEMLLTPSDLPKITTCSYECSRKRRTVSNTNLRSSPEYKRIVKRLTANPVCTECGTLTGPWVVRGIHTWVEDGLAYASGENAKLYCKHCHLKTVSLVASTSLYMTNRSAYYAAHDTDNGTDRTAVPPPKQRLQQK